MKRLRRLVPAKVLYLWEKYGIKRIELFTQEDLEKKPDIPLDTQSKPDIPESGGWVKKLHDNHLTEEEMRRRKHHGRN